MFRIAVTILLAFAVLAPSAIAGPRADIIADCSDGTLQGSYTPSQIRDARNNLPADVDEYTKCRDVLSRAQGGSGDKQLGGASPVGGGAGGGGTGASAAVSGGEAQTPAGASKPASAPEPKELLTPNGPAEQEALDSVQRDSKATAGSTSGNPAASGGPVEKEITPRSAAYLADAGRNPIPAVMFAVLVLVGAALVLATVSFARRCVAGHRIA